MLFISRLGRRKLISILVKQHDLFYNIFYLNTLRTLVSIPNYHSQADGQTVAPQATTPSPRSVTCSCAVGPLLFFTPFLLPPEVQCTALSQCPVSLTASAQRLWSRQYVLSFHQSFFHLIKFLTKWHSIANKGTSLVVQWLRIHLPMQGMWIPSLVWEDSTRHRAAKPMHHNY